MHMFFSSAGSAFKYKQYEEAKEYMRIVRHLLINLTGQKISRTI
jgi:hypothetical protein